MIEFIRSKIAEGALPAQFFTEGPPTTDAVFRWFPYHNSRTTQEQKFFNVGADEVQAIIHLLLGCYREGIYKKF